MFYILRYRQAALAVLLSVIMLTPDPSAAREPQAERQASLLMSSCLQIVREARKELGIQSDPETDPYGTGIVGEEFTPITTSLGNPVDKRTAADPRITAALVRYFREAGLVSGDAIAVGASGSFPGYVLSTLCAAETLGLRPLLICSYGASMYGATIPELTVPAMIERIKLRGLLPASKILAVSMGGLHDQMLETLLYEHPADFMRALAKKSGYPFIDEPDFALNIKKRMELFEQAAVEGGGPVRLFVNCGAAGTNFGYLDESLHLPPGLVTSWDQIPTSSERGLVFEYLSRGVPIVHLLYTKGLCEANGIPYDTPPTEEAFDPFSFSGPKMKDLYYVVMRDMDAQLLAISTGKLDVLSDLYRPADVERLAAGDNVSMSIASGFHGFFITFNVRKFPWDQLALRQAAAQVLDRKKWVRDLFAGYAESNSGFLPHISPYAETELTNWPCDPEAARRHLREAGWSWDLNGWLTAPDGRNLPVTKILCPPSDVAATTTEMAQLMAEALNSIGVPAEAEPMDFQAMLARVDARDFDACTNAWSMTRDPDLLYSFYHSSMDVEGGYNLSGIADPELDSVLLDLRSAPDESAAHRCASKAQKLLAKLMPVLPVYSRYSIAAVQSDWDCVFSSDRTTSDNMWTLISMTPKDGSERPIYWNIAEEVRMLNPLVSSTAYDWSVLGVIYDSLISVNPNTFEDMPWLASSWDITQGKRGSVLTFRLRPDLKWQDGRPLTADDAAFTLKYIKDNKVPRFYDAVKDLLTAEALDKLTLRVSMADTSFWHLHNIGGMLVLPRHVIEKVPDWKTWQPARSAHKAADGSEMTELFGSGPFTFKESRTGEYVHMVRNEHFMLFKEGQQVEQTR